MPLLALTGVVQGFGAAPVLDGADFAVDARERVGLVGRNGAGKSTLLKVLAGELVADEGERYIAPGARVGVLPQAVPSDLTGRVRDVVTGGLGDTAALLARFHAANERLAEAPDDARARAEASAAQGALEAVDGFRLDQRVSEVLTRLDLDGEAVYATLSGGTQRRALLGRALVVEPDLLVLDEPTNHLDIETIEWLESVLAKFKGALVFVSHDRRFLERLVTRVDELDRGRLKSWPGSYANFLRRREEAAAAEAEADARFDKRLAEEEVWIRQGIKARRTRNEGRVRALKAMREERAGRRGAQGTASLRIEAAERSGKRVIVADRISFAHGDTRIVRDFSMTVQRGDRVGFIGPNGAGKTTLLRLLLGQLEPQAGSVTHGTELHIAWFDQHRERLDPTRSVMDNVADGAEHIRQGGESRHVISYLADFLFTGAQARGPIRALSGGERSRLLLARLLARPSNVLVMDEPTNDLDIETLELLEQLLADYPGTLLLVSHDRAFLDGVVTSTVAFEGDGRVAEYVGGYADWLRQRPEPVAMTGPAKAAKAAPRAKASNKLSYKDKRELDALPGRIDTLEKKLEAAQAAMAEPAFFQQEGEAIAAARDALAADEAALESLFERWAELESGAAQ